MKVTEVRSDQVYQKIMNADLEKKDDIYRYELMTKFDYKWSCYHVPMKAKQPGGYDVIMASTMLGYLAPAKIGSGSSEDIRQLSDPNLWKLCTTSIESAIQKFLDAGINLEVQDYMYTILIPDPESVYTKLSEGCCGDGGIPGSIFLTLCPNADTIRKIPAVLAHECNHNVRFQFIKWSQDITLEEMMINEGLAESFATWMYGEEMLGPWVTSIDTETLNDYAKPIIQAGLKVQGFEQLTAYLYGDEIAKERGFYPEGLPFCAGYACGYYMIQHFLRKTGISIVDATTAAI